MELKQWLTTLSAELGTSDVTMDDDAVTYPAGPRSGLRT